MFLEGKMKKKIRSIIILLLFLCTHMGFAQDDNIILFIRDNLPLGEMNPIHKEDTDEINKKFLFVFNNFWKFKNAEISKLRGETLTLLYKNSCNDIEDSVDERRKMKRRSLCFAILGLLSDCDNYSYFFNLAENSLRDEFTNEINDLLYENFAGILILGLYIDYKNNNLKEHGIAEIKSFIKSNETNIDLEFKKNVLKILSQLSQTIKAK